MTLRQREPRIENPGFLAYLRKQPCCACRAFPPSQAAHIRVGSVDYGKRATGAGEKPSDQWAVPLCAGCHLDGPGAQHRVGERVFWAKVAVDPFALALGLYKAFAGPIRETPAKASRSPKTVSQRKRATDSRPKLRPAKRKWPSRPFPKGQKLR